jgi:hypothetical protein
MARASAADRAYFERIAAGNRALDNGRPPASLNEMFDRLERIRESLGALAEPGRPGTDDGDLESHLAFLARCKQIRTRGTSGT